MSDESSNSPDAVSTAPVFEALHSLIDAGFELIKLHHPKAIGPKGQSLGKAPFKNWRTAEPLTADEAQQLMADGHNIGVRLRANDLVVDVDPRNFKDGDDPVKRLEADLGINLEDWPTVITGSNGRHHYMRMAVPILLSDTLDDYQGIEFKAHGRQMVAPGSVHPETGGLYEADPLADDFRSVPEAPNKLLDLARRPSGSSGAEPGEYSPEWLGGVLELLDPTRFRDHDRWLKLMMACHHATGGEGRDEFLAWSLSDPEYAGDEWIVGHRWDSLHADTAGRRVTFGTLREFLVEEGVADKVQPDHTQALDDFADFIDLPPPVHIAEVESDDGNPVDAIINRMNKRFCAVLEGGGYSIYMKDVDDLYDPPRPILTRLTREAFRQYHENERITLPDGKRAISVADLWLKDERMRKYPGIVLDPTGREKVKLNLWTGWSVKPKAGDWSLMRELIEEVLCAGNRKHSEYVLRWIAFMLQRPGEQPQTAIAFRGNEGTGKGTLGRTLMQLAGRHGITVSSAKQLAGNFNAHLRNAVFVFADEAFWPGNKEAEGALKQLVTEPVISFELKGKDVVQGRNHVHLMLASNEDWIVPAGKDARRFAVFDVTEARRNDHEFFGRLKRQMEQEGGLEAMLHDLLAMDLEGWHPMRGVPQTEALADQKLHSLDPASKFWMEVLERGTITVTAAEDEWAAGPIMLKAERQELIDDYDRFLKRNRVFHAKATAKSLAAAGKALGLATVRVDNNTTRAWSLPPLDEARRLFEERVGASGLFG